MSVAPSAPDTVAQRPVAAPVPASPSRPARRSTAGWAGLLLLAMGAWALSLPAVDVTRLGDYGLTPELPPGWYLAVAALAVGACALVAAPDPRFGLLALFVGGLVIALYATVPIVADAPHYHYVYKHIGVARYIDATGGVDAGIDIYHRWPGFFALAAAFGALAGQPDPIAYAAYAEPVFALVATGLVAVAARAVTRSSRVAGVAALIFAVSNWVGQAYFAPQALAFVLTLALLTVVLRHLLVREPEAGGRVIATVARLVRVPQAVPLPGPEGTWRTGHAVAAVLLLDAVIVVTHQLTPYIVVVTVAGLGLLRLIRPRGLWLALAALTLGYLALNFGYVRENFGIFTSFDPFSNAQHLSLYDEEPVAGKAFNARAGQALTFAIWIGAAVAAVRLARIGFARFAAPLAILAAAPFAVILGQNYGGEATLRVILFSSPWCAVLIAWALVSIRRARLRAVAVTGVVGTLLVVFVPAFYGQEQVFHVPPTEVAASEYLYANAPAGSALVLAGPSFPKRYGPRYPLLAGPHDDDQPNLLRGPEFRNRPLGAQDVDEVAAFVRSYADRGYLAFTSSSTEFARVFGLASPEALASLEAAVRRSGRFRLWYGNRDARIYELVGPREPLP